MDRRKSCGGESLVEVLAAILIFTFGSIVLLSMFSAAARIHTQARAQAIQQTHSVLDTLDQDAAHGETVKLSLDGQTEFIPVEMVDADLFFPEAEDEE